MFKNTLSAKTKHWKQSCNNVLNTVNISRAWLPYFTKKNISCVLFRRFEIKLWRVRMCADFNGNIHQHSAEHKHNVFHYIPRDNRPPFPLAKKAPTRTLASQSITRQLFSPTLHTLHLHHMSVHTPLVHSNGSRVQVVSAGSEYKTHKYIWWGMTINLVVLLTLYETRHFGLPSKLHTTPIMICVRFYISGICFYKTWCYRRCGSMDKYIIPG